MSLRSQHKIKTWAKDHPRVVNFFRQLNDAKIPWGMYCGTATGLLVGERQLNDIDIIVRECDFKKVIQLAPPGAEICDNSDTKVVCGDGVVLDFPEHSIKFWLDDKEIEVMASGCATYKGHWYRLEMSELAIKNRLAFDAEGTTIYFSNPFDTMALKSVLQRGASQHKFDYSDIKMLCDHYPPCEDYIAKRAAEVQLDNRALAFLRTCNVPI